MYHPIQMQYNCQRRRSEEIRKRPIFLLACVYVNGIFYAMTGWKQFIGVCVLFLFQAVWKEFQFGKWKSCVVWTAFLLLFFGFAVTQYGRETAFRRSYMDRLTDGELLKICGQIYKKEYKNDSYQYYLKNCSIQFGKEVLPCNRILSYFDSDTCKIGDTLIVNGKVKKFESATNEGQFDASSFYQAQKIDFALCDGSVVKYKQTAVPIGEWLYQLRQKLVMVIKYHLDEAEAGVLASILYGDKSLLLEDVRKLYQTSGISHILAISGLHISLIGMMLYRVLRKQRFSFLISAVLAGIWINLYGCMTGCGISTKRAIGMMILSMGAQVLGRTNDLLNSLGVMVLVLLLENPFLLNYAGFTFSVVAVCGVGITGRIFSNECELENQGQKYPERKIDKIKDKINKERGGWKNGVWMSIAIWLTTLPLVAFYYYEIPLYSVALNLIVLPLLSVVFILGLFGSLIGLSAKYLSFCCLKPTALILRVYSRLCEAIGNLPGANLIVGKPSYQRMVIYYLTLGMVLGLICYLRWRNEWKRERMNQAANHEDDSEGQRRIETIISAIKMIACPVLLGILLIQGSVGNEIDFLDVGQGDGIYISSQDGANVFIDGGSSSVKKVGEYRILPFLKSKGVSHIDYWFVSHTDDDHMNGLLEVMDSGYKINHLVISKYMIRDEAYDTLISCAEQHKIPILEMRKGDAVASKNFRIECIYPNREIFEDKNDMSLVLKLSLGTCTGIFAGDFSSEAEQILVQEHLIDPVDIYKVNHHGSKNSSSEEFMNLIQPRISIISCAKRNRYGHPADEAMERIEAEGSNLFYTMNGGQICVKVQGEHIEVTEFVKQLAVEMNFEQ